jgi:formylglycine-generating enzyme required for sulfatase activity
VASVAEALARPLAGEEKVLLYAAGVERLAAGDTRMARRIFDALGPRDQPTVIGAVAMPAAAALLAGESDEFVNSLGMKFVLIPPGTFLMGSPPEEEGRLIDEGPVHEVEITQPYYLGVYQVTQAEYERVMGMNPSWFSSSGQGKDQVKGQDTRRFPVEFVSWEDAVEFCRKLSEMPEEKKHGRTYRLPTEAEWEYSCRGGASDSKPFYFKDGPTSWLSSTQANFEGNYPYGGAAKGPYLARPTPVGSYQPNAFGLFDMHGNVWEWCADWFDNKYYEKSPKKDPQGPEKGKRRVLRGGSWSLIGWLCRAAYRTSLEPGNRGDFIGFRVLLFAGARTS